MDDGGDNESMIIGNQKIMYRDFAKKEMFQYEYYEDSGYIGCNFTLFSFQHMVADIEADIKLAMPS